jgi:hypothetical protein
MTFFQGNFQHFTFLTLFSCDESEMSSGYTSSELDEMDGLAKKYRQPITMRALNVTIGQWVNFAPFSGVSQTRA